MAKPTFTPLKDSGNNDRIIEVPAGPELWALVEDYILGPIKLKVEVVDPEGLWQYAANQYCKATGTMRNDLGSILPAAPIGALIGKLGGSAADFPPPAPAPLSLPPTLPVGIRLFAIGSYAIVDVKDIDSGPLFLAMNDTLSAFPAHAGKIRVKVSIGT